MRISNYIIGAMLASTIVGSASAGHAAAAGGIGGKVTLPITINFLTAPASTFGGQFSSLTCSLTLTSDDVLTPVDTVTGPVKISGQTGTCNLTMTYLWHVVNAKSNMTVSFAVNGVALDQLGHQTITRLSSGGVEKLVLPANGAVTAFKSFRVVL